jgi:F-type H+-transporting ATPase subunit b
MSATSARSARSMPAKFTGVALALAILGAGAPVLAQPAEKTGSEPERAATGAAGDSARPEGPGSEHHEGGTNPADEAEQDPSKHFNFFGLKPGHLFDYTGKDELGGPFGDGKMKDPETGRVIPEEEPASPPFVFALINFAILLGLLAWKGKPFGDKTARDRHDQIKSALDEAARLRKQAADRLAEYEARLKAADAEITKLIEGIRIDAENEKQEILAAAEAQAAQMKRDAELRIAAEIELARAQLTREVTAAAVAATEKLLRDKMTASDQQKLVAAFITDVQAGGPGSGQGRQGDVR